MNVTQSLSWKNVKITGGFFKKWQDTNASATADAIYDRFYETGRIDAMKLEWKEGMENKPHVYWDSDVAKWMEGVAYLLNDYEKPDAADKLENIISLIEKAQDETGYFNSYFLTVEPQNRFIDRTAHELYTAGHLIEAAVAHFEATGSRRFLDMMCRYADLIENVFLIQKSAPYASPGHQELELALVRLWEATGEQRYLNLSKHFVDVRGTDPRDKVFSVINGTAPAYPLLRCQLTYSDTYAQDDAPARNLPAAAGHAVRAMYFYSAMADIAREYKDTELFTSCLRLWNDHSTKKMYVTGGVSADRHGEAIGAPYHLPNAASYAETCASIAMVYFAQRMFSIEQDSQFTDIIERQIFNGTISGLSIDGKAFFYDNALQSSPKMNDFNKSVNNNNALPIYRRQRLFECSCCPPNIFRFIASISQYIYSVNQDTLYINQYIENRSAVSLASAKINIEQITDYPWDETVTISIQSDKPALFTIALRLPGWCSAPEIKVNGVCVFGKDFINDNVKVVKGYLYITENWQTKNEITMILPMPVVEIEANPQVTEASGKAALMRGPLVYCLEGCDNNINILDAVLPIENKYELRKSEIEGFPVIKIEGKAFIRQEEDWEGILYRPIQSKFKEVKITAIPYFTWANRLVSDMTVWIKNETTVKNN